MEILNQIGHLQHWGLAPAAHLLKHYPFQKHPQRPVRLLISGTADIRHLLKTISDLNQQPPAQRPTIEIYLHQPNKELLCRALLFLHIVHETTLNFQQRIELFLDLYGNALIKERNARYLHSLREDLLNLIHGQKKIATPLKQFVNLKLLKFQERDDMSQIIQSWSMKVPLDMEKLRDNKLRYLYKQRYDYRNNLVDWDFNMLLQECAPIIHFYHYREWRLTGLAFEQRFSRYTQPNRTLASYAPGRKKQERTSCLVRGYWGDIVISPYVALGVKCDYHQSELLFKKANYKNIGHSVEVAQYNMNYWLHRIEKQEKYIRHFRDFYRADEETRKKLQQKNENKKKKKQLKEGQMEEIKEEEGEEKEKQEEDIKENKQPQAKVQQEKQKDSKKKQGEVLDSDEEEEKKRVDLINSKEIVYQPEEKEVLQGFKNFNASVHLMAMPSQKLISNKYQDYFDVICLGFSHSAYLTKGVQSILRPKGLLLVEKGTYIVPKKKEQRKQLNTKLRTLIEQRGFQQAADEADLFAYFKK